MAASLFRPVKIGAVAYLNSKPLIEGLSAQSNEWELSLDSPGRLADDLAASKLDVALIPSVEFLRNREYEIVSDACVASHGPVLSVKLYSRVEIAKIRSLALDEGSRTSAALVQILLEEKFGVEPAREPLPLGQPMSTTRADAILLIGDRAMHPPSEEFVETWDLGEEWLEWTGLPFVFALWASRPGVEVGTIEETLCCCRDRGIESLEQIAAREAPLLKIPETTAVDYLKNNLKFHLGPAEQNGLALFHRLAARRGFADEGVELVFRNRAPA